MNIGKISLNNYQSNNQQVKQHKSPSFESNIYAVVKPPIKDFTWTGENVYYLISKTFNKALTEGKIAFDDMCSILDAKRVSDNSLEIGLIDKTTDVAKEIMGLERTLTPYEMEHYIAKIKDLSDTKAIDIDVSNGIPSL